MRRTLIAWLIFTALAGASVSSQERPLKFSGEVSEGQMFRKSLGHGLDFVLAPTREPEITGWTVKVSPRDKPLDAECADFLCVVTPPYRFQNARYLDTSYGVTAQEAVRWSPREFSFVLNCADLKTESERVNRVLWPYSYSQQEVDEAQAKLGSSPIGRGKLWIKDYRITPGQESGESEAVGAIHWIKFEAEIQFPAVSEKRAEP